MIYIKNLENEEYLAAYKKSLEKRNIDSGNLNIVLEKNIARRKALTEMESKKAYQNKTSEVIAGLKRNKQDASKELAEMQTVSQEIKTLEKTAKDAEAELNELLIVLPNKAHDSVPAGKDETQNVIVKTVGEPTKLSFEPKAHDEIGQKLNILDFDRAGKVTGARFTFLMGLGARLERSLINFMMDVHSQKHGYRETIPPYLVNANSMYGTGNFPKFKQDVFALENTPYYLIPTAEVPVTNYYNGEILNEEDLPQRYAAFSACFRSEAGSYGKDTKGLIRQHQFHKVELMCFVHPDKSYEEHEKLTTHAEEILKQLELPYRRAMLCAGDMSPNAAKCFDLEVWLPAQNTYREISSCSNFEDYQARRAEIRYRPTGGGKPQYVHTLNGSGLAVGRTLVAILENYQQADGSVKIPKALQSYMGVTEIK